MFAEQPVDAGDADVEKTIDGVAHHLGRHARFLGDRQVRCARGRDENRAAAGLHILLTVRDGASDRLKCGVGHPFLHGGERIFARTRDEQGMSARHDLRRDGRDLFGRLA